MLEPNSNRIGNRQTGQTAENEGARPRVLYLPWDWKMDLLNLALGSAVSSLGRAAVPPGQDIISAIHYLIYAGLGRMQGTGGTGGNRATPREQVSSPLPRLIAVTMLSVSPKVCYLPIAGLFQCPHKQIYECRRQRFKSSACF